MVMNHLIGIVHCLINPHPAYNVSPEAMQQEYETGRRGKSGQATSALANGEFSAAAFQGFKALQGWQWVCRQSSNWGRGQSSPQMPFQVLLCGLCKGKPFHFSFGAFGRIRRCNNTARDQAKVLLKVFLTSHIGIKK